MRNKQREEKRRKHKIVLDWRSSYLVLWRAVTNCRSQGSRRSFPEAAGRGQWLHIWKRGGWDERLSAAGGIVVVGSSFFGGQGETRSYKTVSLPEPRESCALSVAVTEAKKVSLAQNCDGSKMKKDDK